MPDEGCNLCQAAKQLFQGPLLPGYENLAWVCPRCGAQIDIMMKRHTMRPDRYPPQRPKV
ncbi:hypothetical protein SAMN05444123_103127 [Rhodopseudomonas pseudopalustris]|uniref:Uncharacterized protein n=1 Tax=Rhodopseudomonas pseudopalustris TaxID=1513892 RepID=A0A1H8QA20_9BRAD|nr:hypothetical protein SAMN05444123_103127 [Rhodopseudomonas pseudopalustris]